MNDNQQNKNAILAVILSGIVLFGWSYFFPTQQPYDVVTTQVESTQSTKENLSSSNNSGSVDKASNIDTEKKSSVTLSNKNFSIVIDNNLNPIESKFYNTDKSFSDFFSDQTSSLYIVSNGTRSKLSFEFAQNDNGYLISDKDNNVDGFIVLSDDGMLNISLKSSSAAKFAFETNTKAKNIDNQKFKSFMYVSDSLSTVNVGDTEDIKDTNLQWFGLDYNYHLLSFVFPKLIQTRLEVTSNEISEDNIRGALTFVTVNDFNNFEYKISFLKKNYDELKLLGNNLHLSVDFGIWSIIAVPILRGLQFFYDFSHNYGIAIILLTILIRFLTFPLQYKSFVSMKKMQVVQPEIQKIKEKFKDNPQKMQQETMALFKKAGANPLGGCLPMLLQMPVFFAFYKVLYSSVELVDAPFYFWIIDLSSKDPYYVLPVLMGIAMFLNMKLTPNTSMDPAQQKIMMFMPIMFSFFMINLPSGLTLYILISTIVGMLQQLFVFKRT